MIEQQFLNNIEITWNLVKPIMFTRCNILLKKYFQLYYVFKSQL